jgi:hypothetical protein
VSALLHLVRTERVASVEWDASFDAKAQALPGGTTHPFGRCHRQVNGITDVASCGYAP